jgi:hypothetical protein
MEPRASLIGATVTGAVMLVSSVFVFRNSLAVARFMAEVRRDLAWWRSPVPVEVAAVMYQAFSILMFLAGLDLVVFDIGQLLVPK